MIFLGKIYLEWEGKRLAVKPDGYLAMQNLPPDDPRGLFLGYDLGGGWFGLQSSTGKWVNLLASQSDKAWYPVLYQAYVTNLNMFGQFKLDEFDAANHRARITFRREDNGALVSLMVDRGINPYCRCEFDVGTGSLGSVFKVGFAAPGIREMMRTGDGRRADFRCLGQACVDLSDLTLERIDFTEADFSGANLRSTMFVSCTLTGAKFGKANLTGTDFRTASIAGADFSGADLTNQTLLPEPPFSNDAAQRTIFRNATIPAGALKKNWSFLDLTGATIVGLDSDLSGLVMRASLAPKFQLSGLILNNADFTDSDLTASNFQYARLESARFSSAILIDCVFSGARLGEARFDAESSDENVVAADLTGAKFSFAELTKASFRNALLLRTVFTAATMDEVDLTGAQLGGVDRTAAASFSYAYLANAKLDKANLFGVNFGFVTLFGASTSVAQTATMEQANFSNAYLAGIDLSEANLRGASFAGACLVNVRLTNAILLPAASGSIVASLAGATLQGADFTGAQLNQADLSNAAVAFDKGKIPVRYCDEDGSPFPEPPSSMPLHFPPTVGLDLKTMGPETKCPNGLTVHENELDKKTIQQMLTSSKAPQEWYPKHWRPAPGSK